MKIGLSALSTRIMTYKTYYIGHSLNEKRKPAWFSSKNFKRSEKLCTQFDPIKSENHLNSKLLLR